MVSIDYSIRVTRETGLYGTSAQQATACSVVHGTSENRPAASMLNPFPPACRYGGQPHTKAHVLTSRPVVISVLGAPPNRGRTQASPVTGGATVLKQLGHATTQVTEKHYARYIPDDPDDYREPLRREAGEVASDLLARMGVGTNGVHAAKKA